MFVLCIENAVKETKFSFFIVEPIEIPINWSSSPSLPLPLSFHFEHQCISKVFHSVCGILSAHFFNVCPPFSLNWFNNTQPILILCGRCREMQRDENGKMKRRRRRRDERDEKNVGHYSLSWYSVARARFRSLHFLGNLGFFFFLLAVVSVLFFFAEIFFSLLMQWSLLYLQWNSFFRFIRIKLDICFVFLCCIFWWTSKRVFEIAENRIEKQKKNQRWAEKRECWNFLQIFFQVNKKRLSLFFLFDFFMLRRECLSFIEYVENKKAFQIQKIVKYSF